MTRFIRCRENGEVDATVGPREVAAFAFAGPAPEAPVGLNYHRARWLDPTPGHWLSEDPIACDPGDAKVQPYVACVQRGVQ